MSTNEILRLVTIAISAAGIVVMVLVAIRYRSQWLYTIAPLAYLVSVIALGIYTLCQGTVIDQETALRINTLSYAVRLQSLIMLTAAGVIFLRWRIK